MHIPVSIGLTIHLSSCSTSMVNKLPTNAVCISFYSCILCLLYLLIICVISTSWLFVKFGPYTFFYSLSLSWFSILCDFLFLNVSFLYFLTVSVKSLSFRIASCFLKYWIVQGHQEFPPESAIKTKPNYIVSHSFSTIFSY